MKKSLSRLLAAVMMAALMILPATGLAEIGNSGKITKDLPATLENLTIRANDLDVELKMVEEGKAPYAELDATVIGINSADVNYDLQVSEDDNGTLIEASHTGSDIGIDHVKVTVYVAQGLDNLALDMNDADLTIDKVYTRIISGQLYDGDLHAKDGEVYSLNVTITEGDLNFDGIIGGVDVTAMDSDIKLNSSVVPAGLTITGNDTDVEIKVPDAPDGFTLTYQITDGRLHTNFLDKYEEASGVVTIGSGEAPFNITLDDGTLRVNKH